MAKKDNVCGEHCEIAHAVLGDGKSNKGHEKRISDIERVVAVGLGIVATINFIWIFIAYPLLMKKLGIGNVSP